MTVDADPPSLLGADFIRRLEKLEFRIRNVLSGEARGDIVTRRRGAGSLFREHRAYIQGDDLRFVDWNVYSRSGELFVKHFDSEESLRLTLFLDATGSMDFGATNKFRHAQKIVAALGFIGLRRHALVELGVLAGKSRARDRGSYRGQRLVPAFLRDLAGTEPLGDVDFEDAMRQLAGAKKSRGVLVVVSDFFTERGYARGLQFLRHLGFQVVVVHVLDARDFRPDISGALELTDLETKKTARGVLDSPLLDRFADEVRRWSEGVERFCAAHEISYLRSDTTVPLEETMTRLFIEKGILG